MQEIERKFLVHSLDFIAEATQAQKIAQGYLNSAPERTVRIRIKDDKGFITIKGKGDATGTTRFEWEKEIDLHEAEALLSLCETGVIDKTRYLIPSGKHIFEVDIFEGENKGLVMAEIELSDANDTFEKPSWLAEEVTNDEKYYNAYLSKKPFTSW
ncbi:MAG: CYTH domain-containing protein [Bacteroidota bacterium]